MKNLNLVNIFEANFDFKEFCNFMKALLLIYLLTCAVFLKKQFLIKLLVKLEVKKLNFFFLVKSTPIMVVFFTTKIIFTV